ncbi:MAG: quinone-dependent dihydroorotate dehydrogenase [Campylobacterales bacterium]|nr:quinone-dependent dihydroorotate dehydrogenase [Campylobacterales bacterium]
MNYEFIKKFLFKLDPENAHNLIEKLMSLTNSYPAVLNSFIEENFIADSMLRQNIFGSTFYNPVGLAAGYDKNAKMNRSLLALGFGYLEFGTITPLPQSGNDKPRLFRYPEYESIQNSFGFNNEGGAEVAKRVKEFYPLSIPIGINIGKNKITSQENAINDYEKLVEMFNNINNYLVINVSSPNTPNLRDLQNEEFIKELFIKLTSITKNPILLKIAPDMSVDNALSLCNVAINHGAKGIIATNTTIDYSLIPNAKNFGGLSGKVLQQKSREFFKELSKELFSKTTLISVGGIDSAEEAYTRVLLGATLIQVYSALIFKGPSLVKDINLGIIEKLKRDGFNHISEAVGKGL